MANPTYRKFNLLVRPLGLGIYPRYQRAIDCGSDKRELQRMSY